MRQTSHAAVAVVDETRRQTIVLSRSDPKVRVDTFRGRGKGGQHRNTTDSSVRVSHADYPDLVVTRISGRSQTQNLDSALAELAGRIAGRRHDVAAQMVNCARQAQSTPEIAFTHSAFTGRVRQHATGRAWDLRAWAQGRWH
jgi:protein subunit release factor A